MPWRIKHSCSWQGCGALIEYNERYCKKHKKLNNILINIKRNNIRQYWSSWEWRKIRNEFLRKNSICAICGNEAAEVDHIVPVRLGGTNDESNLQALCKSCHSRKTAKEGRWG